MARNALGKGLEAIFGDVGSPVPNPKNNTLVHEIELGKITPNPFQPRREFKPEEIRELADSIAEKGLLQPILVRKHGQGYQIIAGERRFRAFGLLGKARIHAMVRDQLSDRDMMEIALIENLQRVQLNAMEEAEAFEQLINACGLTHEELARKMGKSRSAITNTLRLLKLEKSVQDLVKEGKLSAGHARALLHEPVGKQLSLARNIIENSLNVRQTEKIGARTKGKSIEPLPSRNPNLDAFLDQMRYSLGVRITHKGSSDKGTIELHFSSRQELETIGDIVRRGSGIGQ